MPKAMIHLAILLALAGPAAAAEPALDRVTFSSGGVGQFEFTADIDGAATLPLAVPLDQVDDLLKSLRVDDPAGGMHSVRLPGREPLAESFRPLPFSPAAFASTEALLGTLVGEAVRLPAAGIAGHILAVTPFGAALPDGGGTLTRHRLTIATDAGIATAVLQDMPSVEFDAEPLRRQIASALAAIAAQRVQDRRTMQLSFGDGGQRAVRFGYVVPAPVWKASYRLTIPAADAPGPATLQGFAVVENLSGRDWRGVEVLLTSGQPVLYHQPLYEAVFTTRPEAPVEVPNRITPQLDAALVEPRGATVGLTPTHYRIARAIPAGVTDMIEVTLERPRSERIVLADTATTRLLAMAEEGRLSPELRTAMARAAGLRTELDQRSAALRRLSTAGSRS